MSGVRIGVADAPAVLRPALVSVVESLGVADAPAVVGPAVVQLLEGIGVADTPALNPSVFIAVVEAIGVADGPALDPSVFIAVSEVVGVADAPAAVGPAVVQLLEGIGVADAPKLIASPFIRIVEAIGIADLPSAIPPALIQLAEAIGVLDDPAVDPGDDVDGIEAVIDGSFDGTFTDESTSFSDSFTDEHRDGTTFGGIDTRDGLTLTVIDHSSLGIEVEAAGGAGTAKLGVCAEDFVVLFTNRDRATLTCGSLDLEVVEGPVEVELRGGETLIAPNDTVVTIIENLDGTSEVENSPTSTEPVTLVVDGVEVPLAPGDRLTTEDPDKDGVPSDADRCPAVAGSIDAYGCPFGDQVLVELHIVDQIKSGICPNGAGSCKLPIEGAEVRAFDRADAELIDAFGRNPRGESYGLIFEAAVGLVAECVTDAAGACTAAQANATDRLLIIRYQEHDGSPTAYTGRPRGDDNYEDITGLAHSDYQFIKALRKNGTEQYSGGSKTVINGSYIEIVFPTFAVWDDIANGYLYPFIFTSDSDWDVDLCSRVPHGYEITGAYDDTGTFTAGATCVQSFVSGETKVIAFEVIDVGSPEPFLSARLRATSPHGVVTALNLDVPGIRVAQERARGGPFAANIDSTAGAGLALLLPLVVGAAWFRRRGDRK